MGCYDSGEPLLAVKDAHGLLLDSQAVVQLQLRIIQHVRGVQDAHGLLLDSQAVVQLQLRIIKHMRWVRDVFFDHGHMKYITDPKQGGW